MMTAKTNQESNLQNGTLIDVFRKFHYRAVPIMMKPIQVNVKLEMIVKFIIMKIQQYVINTKIV